MAITQADIKKVQSLINANATANITLVQLGAKAVRNIYRNKDGELAQFMLDNVPVTQRRFLASWFRRQGCVVDALDAKVTGKRDLFAIGSLPLDAKKQHKVFERIAHFEAVVTGQAERTADFNGDVIPLTERTYKAPAKKELSAESSEVIKRAKEAVAKVISRMKETDPLAAGVLNMIWANKQTTELALMDSTGQTINLSEEECNAMVGYLHQMRQGG